MRNFIFEVTRNCVVVGYDIYDHNKQIVNYHIKEGFYLAFYEFTKKEIERIKYNLCMTTEKKNRYLIKPKLSIII